VRRLGAIAACGHYGVEEALEETYEWFLRFFGDRSA